MAVRNRTIIRQEQTFAAADAAITDNLPVNPLSFVDIVIRGLNNGANARPPLGDMLAVLTTIEILFKGSSIISLSPRDLFALGYAMGWVRSMPHVLSAIDNEIWRILLRLSFSRRPFWINEGFPASRAGELQIRYTPAATFTGVDGTSLEVETEEILDAQFTRFLKYTTLSRTPTATGESDLDLPIGNPYSGILLFGTTVPTGAAVTASMREVRMLIDNQEAFIPRTRWDTIHQNFLHACGWQVGLTDHRHLENTATAYTQNATTVRMILDGSPINPYGWLEFDPLRDGSYLLPTEGRSSVKLRINADVADAQRIIPLELISVAGAPAA